MIKIMILLVFVNYIFSSFLNCKESKITYNSQIIEFYIENKMGHSSIYFFEINKKEYLLILDNKNNTIYKFNYPNMELKNKYTPDFEIGGVLLLESNLILLNRFDTFEYNIYNTDSNKIINELFNFTNSNYKGYHNLNFNTPILLYNNQIYFNAVINISPPKFFDYNCLGKIDLADSSIKIFGEFPEKMKDGNVWLDFYPNLCRKDDELLVSFNPDSMIYIYDLEGNLKKSVEVSSKYVNEILPPDQEKSRNPNFSMQYQITSPLYHNVLYDKYRKVFYRIVTQSNDFYNLDGTVTDYFAQPFSIIIFDEEYKILDELYFQNGIYDFTKIFVTKDGLLVGHKAEGNSLKFNLITIKR